MNVTLFEPVYYQLKNARKFFYLVTPNESTFQYPEEVPNYWEQIWGPFLFLMFLEQVLLFVKNGTIRMNDHITSISLWLFEETIRFFSRGVEYSLYIFIYEKFHLWDLAWNSIWTWIIAALSVEFCYYWAHRCNHEVHFLWAFHQVHHSSQEFNLTIGLRQSILQSWCNFIFFSPLALFVPPTHYMAHKQLNLIYQLWIHTMLIGDLGPLEWIFNTAKHHRVHHGCNIYCLDKNYGGVLIIWDRLFGTFQEEMNDEIIYGLVTNVQSFNPLYLQIFYLKDVIMKSISMQTWADKFAVFWKGPSWFPGGPRLGLEEYKIHVKPRSTYNVDISEWIYFYIIIHFYIVIYKHMEILILRTASDFWTIYVIVNNLLTFVNIGLMLECKEIAGVFELVRCAIYLFSGCIKNAINGSYFYLHLFSYMIWLIYFLQHMMFISNGILLHLTC